jgi:glycerophosphoryl diester phosphodiesterase
MQKTKITAHRGYAKTCIENTIPAFKEALELGADRIELDVHFSADKQLVVHHDCYLPGGSEGQKTLLSTNYGEMDPYIPLLAQVFQEIGRQIEYEIELKGFHDEFIGAVVEAVREFDLTDLVEFTSPYPVVLGALRDISKQFRLGVFLRPYPDWMTVDYGEQVAIGNLVLGEFNVAHCPAVLLTGGFLERLHANGLMAHWADCNTQEELRRAFELGVDQLSTDELELALEVRERVQRMS